MHIYHSTNVVNGETIAFKMYKYNNIGVRRFLLNLKFMSNVIDPLLLIVVNLIFSTSIFLTKWAKMNMNKGKFLHVLD